MDMLIFLTLLELTLYQQESWVLVSMLPSTYSIPTVEVIDVGDGFVLLIGEGEPVLID